MELLKKTIDELVESLAKDDRKDVKERLDNLVSVYPFNEFEFIISALLGLDKITLDDYYEIRDDYIARNMYLYIFEISAPRGFGEQWAQGHVMELVPEVRKPSKKIDDNYSGQYDLYLQLSQEEGVKIEVKASRAVDFDSREALYVKALSSASDSRFDMNFQQVKPKCCDVFIWVGVWRDEIRYWVLASSEVKNNKYYSTGQHRGNTGEGQLHLKKDNIEEFKQYEVEPPELYKAIIEAFQRQQGVE
jgi:hypothetical protein